MSLRDWFVARQISNRSYSFKALFFALLRQAPTPEVYRALSDAFPELAGEAEARLHAIETKGWIDGDPPELRPLPNADLFSTDPAEVARRAAAEAAGRDELRRAQRAPANGEYGGRARVRSLPMGEGGRKKGS